MTKRKNGCPAVVVLAAIGAYSMAAPRATGADRTEIAFPRDPSVIDLRVEFGALGSDKEGGWIGWALYSGWKPAGR